MTFDEIVLKELNGRVESLSQTLLMGNVKDYAEYRYMVGELRGLSLAVNTVKDLAANIRDSDD